MSKVQNCAEDMIARHGFMGIPVETFEEGGRRQFIALLNQGLNLESRILEIGCGCLRVAYWLIPFLDPECYHGIEPARRRVELGLQSLFTPEEVRLKQPTSILTPTLTLRSLARSLISFLQDQYGATRANRKSKRRSMPSFVIQLPQASFSRRTSAPCTRMTIARVLAGSEPATSPLLPV